MKITLLSEDSIRLEGFAETLTIEADSCDKSYSPFHMLASAVASCTHSVLSSWAGDAKLDTEPRTSRNQPSIVIEGAQ